MKFSKLFCPTLKETPKDAEVVSHQLMLRAGMIRKVAAGIYAYLPLGLRSLRKFESIVREEMERSGALEVSMPSIIPSSLWKQSGRWDKYGKELLRITDRHDNEFCYGPTHEEVITEIAAYGIRSYKQLPMNLFQIQTKFRDEIRPRFGLMRGREFTMKDGYSFHASQESLDETYTVMADAYKRIFERCGLSYRQVHADSGAIGGSESSEFMVIAQTGEDEVLVSDTSEFASNVEAAATVKSESSSESNDDMKNIPDMAIVETPDAKTIEDVAVFLKVKPSDCMKALLYDADGVVVMVLLRGDHDVNEVKLTNILECTELKKATDEQVKVYSGADPGFLGPINLKKACPVYADHGLSLKQGLVSGANETDAHYTNVVLERDLPKEDLNIADLRVAKQGDICPEDGGKYESIRGIEVGHIFKLGDLYSKALDGMFLNEKGKSCPMKMGCYGIGIGRTVAAAIEQQHDEKGIVWPIALAPFIVDIIVIGKDDEIKKAGEDLYQDCIKEGIDVILDDRAISPGIKFKDAELIGFPIQCILGKQFQEKGEIELVTRYNLEKTLTSKENLMSTLTSLIKGYGS